MIGFCKTVLAAALLGCTSAMHYQDDKGQMRLRFNPDGKFTVMQLTDTHFGESEEADQQTIDMINTIMAKEKPDFVAVTGDIVSGYAFDPEEPNWYELQFAKLGQTLQAAQVPFGVVAGYHDYESGLDSLQIEQVAKNYNYCLNGNNAMSHTHNGFTFMVPVQSNDENMDTALRLWFFGTGRNDCLGQGGNDCIRRDQIQWYISQSEKISSDDLYKRQGIAFMHHALQEHMNLGNSYPVHGVKRDVSACQAVNTGLFSEMSSQGNIAWITAGGDHSTDFWGQYGNINLAYGRKSGFGSYGPKFIQHGARIFEVYQNDQHIDSHIRQEDGSMDPQYMTQPHNEFSWLNKSVCVGAQMSQEEIIDDIKNGETRKRVSQNLGIVDKKARSGRRATRNGKAKTKFSDLKFEQD